MWTSEGRAFLAEKNIKDRGPEVTSGVWETKESGEDKERWKKIDGPGDIRNILVDLVRMWLFLY